LIHSISRSASCTTRVLAVVAAMFSVMAAHAQDVRTLKPLLAAGNGAGTETHAVLPDTLEAVLHIGSNNPGTFTGLYINNHVGATRFYNAGITGQNSIVANVEAGHVWNGHQTLGHVNTFNHHSTTFGSTTSDLYDRHATWVGHMIGGRNTAVSPGNWQTGIAYGTDLRSGAIATSWVGNAYASSFNISFTTFSHAYVAYFGTANVINSSWGFTDQPGTNAFTIALDGLVSQNPQTTFVASAGNSGPNANTVGAPGSGYNGITVGALGGANAYTTIASFSSRGAQSYGDPINGVITGQRAAVDIVAPGQSLTGAFYGGQTGGNHPGLSGSTNTPGSNLYSSGIQGTSFSAPIVAGGAALLNSYANTNPGFTTGGLDEARDTRIIKAVLLNSADKLPGWNNGQSLVGNQIVTTQSLDYTFGAGAMNLDRAFTQYVEGVTGVAGTAAGNQGKVSAIGWDLGTVTQAAASVFDNYYFIDGLIEAGTSITATLTWLRDRTFNPTGFVTADVRQADLDLYIFATNAAGTLLGDIVAASISSVNVVEHLAFDFIETGYYGIAIDYFGNNFGSGTSITYGLAWSTTATIIPEPAVGAIVLMVGIFVIHRPRRGRHHESLQWSPVRA
jgi:hypothetical protein